MSRLADLAHAPRRAPEVTPDAAPDAAPVRPQRPSLTVVGESPRAKRSPFRTVGFAVLLFVLVEMVGAALLHVVLVDGQSQLDRLDREESALRSEVLEQRAEAAELLRPERIIAVAEQQGMVQPAAFQPLTPAAVTIDVEIEDEGAEESGVGEQPAESGADVGELAAGAGG